MCLIIETIYDLIWGILKWYKYKYILRSYSQIISKPCMTASSVCIGKEQNAIQ